MGGLARVGGCELDFSASLCRSGVLLGRPWCLRPFLRKKELPVNPNLVARIERLEGQLRRWKLISMAIVVAGLAVLVTTAGRSQQPLLPFDDEGDSIQLPANRLAARDFTLVGRDGKPYGRLYVKDDRPKLEFYDLKGRVIWSAPPPAARGGFKPVQAGSR
jgi:hypothetical protein